MEEIVVRLLKLQDQWLLSEVEEVEEAQFGDPDCILRQPREVVDGELRPWPPYSDDPEIVIRSSEVTVIAGASKALLARYYDETEGTE